MKTVFTNSKETNVMVWAKFDLVSKNLNKEWANQLVTYFCKKSCRGTSPVIQWLRLHALNAGSPSSIPGQGTRSCMPQLRLAQPKKRERERWTLFFQPLNLAWGVNIILVLDLAFQGSVSFSLGSSEP